MKVNSFTKNWAHIQQLAMNNYDLQVYKAVQKIKKENPTVSQTPTVYSWESLNSHKDHGTKELDAIDLDELEDYDPRKGR